MFDLLTYFFSSSSSSSLAGIDETVEMIRANGGTCVGYKVDISKKEEVYKAADAIRRDVGDVSVLYNMYIQQCSFNHCSDGKLGNEIYVNIRMRTRTHEHRPVTIKSSKIEIICVYRHLNF